MNRQSKLVSSYTHHREVQRVTNRPPPARVVTLLFGLLISTSFLSPSTANAGPEVTCGWCVTVQDMLGNAVHGFPNPTDLCGYPNPGDGVCMRCGGTAPCHSVGVPIDGDGPCNHLACGGEGLAAIQVRIGEAIEAGDAVALSQLLAEHHDGVRIHDRSDAGRLEIFADCAPDVVALTYAVRPALRSQLNGLAAAT